MSNKFSKKKMNPGTPYVCKTPPPPLPPLPLPPPTCHCEASPEPAPCYPWGTVDLDFIAARADFPYGAPIIPTWFLPDGFYWNVDPGNLANGIHVAGQLMNTNYDPFGPHNLHSLMTWPDASTCILHWNILDS